MASINYSISLPTEIWLSIIARIPDDRTLNNLRRVSSRLYAIATPATFKNLDLPDTPKGLKVMRGISQTPSIACAVKKLRLAFLGPRDGGPSRSIRGGTASSHFPRLETLTLEIGPTVGRSVHANLVVGELMLVNASVHTARLRDMRLTGLTIWPTFSVWSDATAAALQALKSLTLHFGFRANAEIVHQMRVWDGAFTDASTIGPARAPRVLGQWRLTHLVLSASNEGPAYSPCRGMHDASFPNLVSLRISWMVFRHPDPPLPPTAPGALEAFIVRHPNLRALAIHDCRLQKDDAGGAFRSWATMCRALSRVLTSLVCLSTFRYDEHAAAGMHDGAGALVCPCWEFPIGYASVSHGMFERSVFYDPTTAVQDMEALEVLQQVVRHRARR
ncbi:hypothetical protein HWV62_12821 [Athelia sp. TMB]|nr:hypothetical protein HWV62_12821 [Athelia sp. TMB]